MASIGKPVTDADAFTVAADGTVTVVITEPDDAPVVAIPVVTKSVVESKVPIAFPQPAKGNFEKVFQFVIKWEGSEYEDVLGDPGGPTKYGIDSKDHPGVDIKGLSLENAKAIYLTNYWQASNCDNLPSPVAETHFNFAVNTGREQSVKFMQRALGLDGDGQFGKETADALAKADPRIVALGMVAQADGFYKSLAVNKGMDKFLTGWLNRNNALRSFIG
jgi:lysozyme family protein